MNTRSSYKSDVTILTYWPNKGFKSNGETTLTKVFPNTIDTTQSLARASDQLVNHIAPSKSSYTHSPAVIDCYTLIEQSDISTSLT